MSIPERPVVGVGNVSFEGCGECGLASIITDLVKDDKPSPDLRHMNMVGQVHHVVLEINGSKRPEGFAKPSMPEESLTLDQEQTNLVGQIAVKLGVEDEAIDSFVDAFTTCINCPKPVDWNTETFAIFGGRAIPIEVWKKTNNWHS